MEIVRSTVAQAVIPKLNRILELTGFLLNLPVTMATV